jgi:probable rRNA maturation factor
MNVTVDIENDCLNHWVPEAADVEYWINSAHDAIDSEIDHANVSVRVVTEQDSASLNKQYRDKDYATNVLSFTCELPASTIAALDNAPLGDIAICAPVVEIEAKQQGKSLSAHWAHLLTHGFLHLSGYEHDDKASAEIMESAEIAILSKLGFPNPYLTN